MASDLQPEPFGLAAEPRQEAGAPGAAIDGADLASHTVPVATPEQAARGVMNPWILLKVKALGELVPGAGIDLEKMLDQGSEPGRVAAYLKHEYKVNLSELEIARYGGWLPEIRRDALRKAQARSERLVREVKDERRERSR